MRFILKVVESMSLACLRMFLLLWFDHMSWYTFCSCYVGCLIISSYLWVRFFISLLVILFVRHFLPLLKIMLMAKFISSDSCTFFESPKVSFINFNLDPVSRSVCFYTLTYYPSWLPSQSNSLCSSGDNISHARSADLSNVTRMHFRSKADSLRMRDSTFTTYPGWEVSTPRFCSVLKAFDLSKRASRVSTCNHHIPIKRLFLI